MEDHTGLVLARRARCGRHGRQRGCEAGRRYRRQPRLRGGRRRRDPERLARRRCRRRQLRRGGGHSGSWRLSHWSPNDYDVATTQTIRRLDNKSWYTLSTWIRRSAGQNDSRITLACGLEPVSAVLPAQTTGWLRIVVSAEVRGESCEISLSTKAAGGEWANFDDVTLTPGRAALSVLGADVSSLAKSEDLGASTARRTARHATPCASCAHTV